MNKQKKILITGNKGYIAYNLAIYLSKKGFCVGGFDKKDGINAENFVIPKRNDIFAIVHLAALSSTAECNKSIDETVKNNIIAASNIFSQATTNSIPVIFTSSQAAKFLNSVYGLSKRYAECYAHHFNDHGGQIRILRLSNVYGGEKYIQSKNSVVAKFFKSKIDNNYIIVNGTGAQTRDFVHVDDVCEAIYLSLYNLRDLDEPIDIGSGTQISILELARLYKCDIQFNECSHEVGVMSNKLDLKPAKNILGYEPKHKVDDYISGLIKSI